MSEQTFFLDMKKLTRWVLLLNQQITHACIYLMYCDWCLVTVPVTVRYVMIISEVMDDDHLLSPISFMDINEALAYVKPIVKAPYKFYRIE